MDSKSYSELVRETSQGYFKPVNTKITTEKLKLDDITAAKIVIECCRILAKNNAPAVIEEDLHQLLKTCVKFINKLQDNYLLGYFQSLYFIVKFFFTKKRIDLVLELKSLCIPEFRDSLENANTKLEQTYSGLCNLIQKSIVDLADDNSSDRNAEIFRQLCVMSLQMKSVLSTPATSLANTVCVYLKTPIFSKTDGNVQYTFYLDTLKLLEKCTKTERSIDLNDFYSALVKILQVVVDNLFEQNKLTEIRKFIKITLDFVELWDIDMFTKLFNILHHSSQLVVTPEEFEENSAFSVIKNLHLCSKNLKYLSKCSLKAELHEMSDLLKIIFHNILDYYERAGPLIWNKYFEEQLQLAICKFLGDLGQLISQTETKCRHCEDCKLKRDLYTAVKIIMPTSKLLYITLTQKASISKSVITQVLHYLKCCCTYIQKLQQQNCPQWKTAWGQVGIMTYNIGVKLFSLKYFECCDYFILVIKNLIHWEDPTTSSAFSLDVLKLSLHCLSDINIQTFQFEKALMFSALYIILYPNSVEPFKIFTWVKIKSKEKNIKKDRYLQHLTVVEVILQQEAKIKDLYPNLNTDFDTALKEKLLIHELEQYKAMWPSRIPMMVAFKELCEVADLLTVVKVLIRIWGDDVTSAHNDIDKLLCELTSKFELKIKEQKNDEENIEKQLYLAMLYALQYYSQTYVARQKIANDIKNMVTSEQPPLLPHEMPKNPNDECDLVSLYAGLQLHGHIKVFKLLTKSLTLFNKCISENMPPIVTEICKLCNLLHFTVKMAHEFRLHCSSLHAIEAWFLCLKMARLLNDKLYMLQSISFLLEETNMSSEFNVTLIKDGEKLERELSTLATLETWEALTLYYIKKSKMFLRHQKVDLGMEEYNKALECISKTEAHEHELLQIQLNFLHLQYLQLPCNLQIENHGFFLRRLFGVFTSITSFVKEMDDISSFTLTILFEVYQFVVHMYQWMCLPREVRCYCRDVTKYAQQLLVPLRTAQFLIYLAHADLLTVRLDDCQVKINGISDILCLDNGDGSYLQNEIATNDAATKKDTDLSKLTENFAEIMLDCPSTDYKYQAASASSGSPILYVKPFKLPSFVSHTVDCNCFYCMSAEYKNLVLEYINLEAQLHVYRRNTEAACDCFNGGLRLYRNILGNAYKTKITKFFSGYPLHDLENILCQAFCFLLLNYGNELLRRKDIKKTDSLNQELLATISAAKYQNMFLYSEANLQKTYVLEYISEQSELQQVNAELSDLEDDDREPEDKQSKVLFPICHSPRPNSPPKRRWRRIKCNFSDEESENSDHSAQSTDIPFADSDAAGTMHLTLPVISACKTPVATCSAVCAPVDSKIVKKSKPLLLEIPSTLPTSKLVTNNDNNSTEKGSPDVIPGTPERSAAFVLEYKTKLLTKKVQKSTSKIPVTDVNREKSKKLEEDNISKNLLNELPDVEHNADKKTQSERKKKTKLPSKKAPPTQNAPRTRATSGTETKQLI